MTVADAMIHFPKTCRPDTTVDQARLAFADDHVHALLVTENDRLLAVVERPDLVGAPAASRARPLGGLAGRTVPPEADLIGVRRDMSATGRRRLAVVDDHGRLLGMLCLKRSGYGFCSDAGVLARAAERSATHL
jgi:CBS domain-containing protein